MRELKELDRCLEDVKDDLRLAEIEGKLTENEDFYNGVHKGWVEALEWVLAK